MKQSLEELTELVTANSAELRKHFTQQNRTCMTTETRKESQADTVNQAKITKTCAKTVTEILLSMIGLYINNLTSFQ